MNNKLTDELTDKLSELSELSTLNVSSLTNVTQFPSSIIIGFLISLMLFFLANISAPALAATLPDPVSFRIQIEMGNTEQAREWLEAGLDPNFQGDQLGGALHIAAWTGNTKMLELFIGKGARINLLNKNGETPLHMAALQGKTTTAEWLIAKGANINPDSRTEAWSALHYAAFSGKKELVSRLLEKGADINARAPNGTTPLMSAIYEGKRDIAEALIRLGADRTLKNDWGDGALEWAKKNNHEELVRLINSPEKFSSTYSRASEAKITRRPETLPADLQKLLAEREQLVANKESTKKIDDAIAALRAQYARQALGEMPTINREKPRMVTLSPLVIRPTESQKRRLLSP